MSSFFYYTNELNLSKIFSSLTILPEVFYSRINFSPDSFEGLVELETYKKVIPLFKKNDFSFDKNIITDESIEKEEIERLPISIVCLELDISCSKYEHELIKFEDNQSIIVQKQKDAEVIIIKEPLIINKNNFIKNIYFTHQDSIRKFKSHCRLSSDVKATNLFIDKIDIIDDKDHQDYPYLDKQYNPQIDLQLDDKIERICLEDGYRGLIVATDYYQSIRGNPKIDQVSRSIKKLTDLVALKKPDRHSLEIKNILNKLSSIINDISKKQKNLEVIYESINGSANSDTSRLEKKIYTLLPNFKILYPKILFKKIMSALKSYKNEEESNIRRLLNDLIKKRSFESQNLRKDQVDYIGGLIEGEKELEEEKLHLILSRLYLNYSSILLDRYFINKFDGDYDDTSISQLKDFLFNLNIQLKNEIINKRNDTKYYSFFKKNDNIEKKSITLLDDLNLEKPDLDLCEKIINDLLVYAQNSNLPKDINLTDEGKNQIVRFIAGNLKKDLGLEDDHIFIEELREINKYFKNPVSLVTIQNMVLRAFYNFLLNPKDLNQLTSRIDKNNTEEFITIAFWGAYCGFSQINKDVYKIAMGNRDLKEFGSSKPSNDSFKELYTNETHPEPGQLSKESSEPTTSNEKNKNSQKRKDDREELTAKIGDNQKVARNQKIDKESELTIDDKVSYLIKNKKSSRIQSFNNLIMGKEEFETSFLRSVGKIYESGKNNYSEKQKKVIQNMYKKLVKREK